jgi:hypothetical protein
MQFITKLIIPIVFSSALSGALVARMFSLVGVEDDYLMSRGRSKLCLSKSIQRFIAILIVLEIIFDVLLLAAVVLPMR